MVADSKVVYKKRGEKSPLSFFFMEGNKMRDNKEKEFNLEIDDSINEIIDEAPGSNSFIALRKLRWNDNGKFKLDLRKWYTNNEGEEIAGKGVSFSTEEGPSNLIEALLKHGYGETRKTLNGIKDREDFPIEVKRILKEKNINIDDIEDPTIDSIDEEYYDPKSILS